MDELDINISVDPIFARCSLCGMSTTAANEEEARKILLEHVKEKHADRFDPMTLHYEGSWG